MQKSFLRETAGAVMRSLVVVLTIVLVFVSISALYEVESGISDGTCNIAVLPIEGVIVPYHGVGDFELITTPETVESFMSLVEDDEEIDGVLLEINSPGGTPVASERIAERFRESSLPIIGLIGDQGASGGYMIASAADYLIASPMSDVGGIGVNMSYVEESAKNEEEGLTYVQLTTGKFKDTGSPNRPITEEERELLQKDLDIVHNYFIDLVAKYRNMDREAVSVLSDGSTMTGTRALDNNLVDKLGGRNEAKLAFAEILEKNDSDIIFCEYESGFLPF
ncbi:signal peptide peptidase SppA [Candidatus Nomurabacteria bacterium]|nr:signal peptide peptidase SppA [Candidatus Kaiserbacteria bacterium]MCB9810496.1 signal peptide peptidase SppA [Candidatus Nomurabacteria bacterium]MCB9818173.1 signal peptide peptidase SppA [Candidatus Nomurabacteria bacterium]